MMAELPLLQRLGSVRNLRDLGSALLISMYSSFHANAIYLVSTQA